MRWFTRVFSVLLGLCLVLGAVPTALGEDAAFEQYEWPDDKLRGAVISSLEFTYGYLSPNTNVDDVETLRTLVTTLDLTDCGYTELPDLSVFTSMDVLFLDNNPITQLDVLEGDTRLVALSVTGTSVTELPYLPNLTRLAAARCNLKSFDTIKDPSTLTHIMLGAEDRPLTPQELALVSACGSQLNCLYLSFSSLDNFSFLENMPSLTTLCFFSGSSIELDNNAYANISRMPLTDVTFENTGLTNIDFLADIHTIEELYLPNNQITDLSPLVNMANLHTLKISHNPIEDISGVANMSSLRNLQADSCKISDLTPLESCKSLYVLRVDNNNIESLQPLSELRSLHYIVVDYNKIADISPLSKLGNIQRLWLSGNQITDPTPLEKLAPLSIELYDNPLDEEKVAAYKGNTFYTGTREEYDRLVLPFESDCAPLVDALNAQVAGATYRDARDCKSINLQDAALTNFPDMSAFKSLSSLYIVGNSFTSFPADITGLATLSIGSTDRPLTQAELDFAVQNQNIHMLFLSASSFTGLEPLAALTNLEWLIASANENANAPIDLTPLAKLKKLDDLELVGCAINIDTLQPIAKKAVYLSIINTPLTEDGLAAIGKCSKLASLNIHNCAVYDISSLSKLKQLVHLNLRDNQITDITPLAKLTKLTHINLMNNQVSDITPLAKLKKLEEIDLTNNTVSDVSPIYKLKNLTTLTLSENPVAAPNEVLETFPFAALN